MRKRVQGPDCFQMSRREFAVGLLAAASTATFSAKMSGQSSQGSFSLADGDTLRAKIRKTLFIPEELPRLDTRNYGQFSPMTGVVAERVSFATTSGMRIPGI